MTNVVGVDVTRLAALLSVSTRYVYKLAALPGFPARVAPGRFDAVLCAIWYIRFLQTELDRRGDVGGAESPDYRAARLALVAGQAEKVGIQNKVARGELWEKDSLTVLWSRRAANCQRRLRAIPAGLGPTLTNKTDPAYCVHRLGVAIDEALAELDGPAGGCAKPRRDGRRRWTP